MKAAEIRNKLHHFIDNTADKKIKAIYTIFEENIEADNHYTHEFKAELDRRYAEYKKDGKTVSREEMNNQIKKLLNN